MNKNKIVKPKSISILSLLFSIFIVIGHSYIKNNNWDLVFGNLINFTIATLEFISCYILLKIILKHCYKFLDNKKFTIDKIKDNKLVTKFNKHPFIYSIIIMLLCWLPYIISFYPAILSPDPSFQIKQFFGITTKYANYSILLDNHVLITNHHPVIHTLLLGGCIKLGMMMNSVNLGLFIYSIIQITILITTLAYTILYMRKLKLPNWFSIGSLIIYSLTPVFPFYAMSAVKDVIFGSLIILYIILIYEMLNKKDKISVIEILKSIILIILVTLFRNNGIYVVLLSFPFLIVINKQQRKKLLIIFLSATCMYFSYSKIILPAFKITPGSIREVLSIPFQQTARYVKDYSEDLTNKDKENIDKILNIDTIAKRYNPDLADPVKNEFNKYSTNEDLINYFGTWFNGLLKHPDVYVQATINNVYGYFCPFKTSWYIYHKYDTRITQDGFDYHYNNLSESREVLSDIGVSFPFIPIIGLIVNIAFNTWLIFIMTGYLIYLKRYKEIVVLAPAIILILVCIASPANTYFRYALPYIFGMPLIIGIFLNIVKKERGK